MSQATGYRSPANARTEGNLQKDVHDKMFHIGEPSAYPIVALTGGKVYKDGGQKPQDVPGIIKKEIAKQPRYSVLEKSSLSRVVTVNGAVADTTTTTVTLDSNTKCRIGDVLFNQTDAVGRNGEVMFVTAVDAGGADLTVRRNLGSTSFTISDNATLKIIGNGFKTGGAKATLVSQLAEERERRTQIFKRSFAVDDTLKNSLLYAGEGQNAAWDEEMTQAAVNHNLDREFSWWYNAQADSTTDASGNPVNMTRGILGEIGDSRTVFCGGSLDKDMLFGEVAEEAFEYGPRRKRWFCDAVARSAIDRIVGDNRRVQNKETKYGLMVQEIETSHGIAEIISCGVYSEIMGASKGGYIVSLDTDRVKYKYIKNRDTKYEADIQTRGDDAIEAQFVTECGLLLCSLDHHRIIQIFNN
jgi:hypothetical protein